MSSDLEQGERQKVMNDFANRRIQVLVATDIVSRGIDIDNISMIVNYDVPHDAEDYVHRIGRTARADSTGIGLTFISDVDQGRFAKIEQLIEKPVNKLPLPAGIPEGPEYNPRRGGGGGGRGSGSSGRGGSGGSNGGGGYSRSGSGRSGGRSGGGQSGGGGGRSSGSGGGRGGSGGGDGRSSGGGRSGGGRWRQKRLGRRRSLRWWAAEQWGSRQRKLIRETEPFPPKTKEILSYGG
jgi:hypothetical protein